MGRGRRYASAESMKLPTTPMLSTVTQRSWQQSDSSDDSRIGVIPFHL